MANAYWRDAARTAAAVNQGNDRRYYQRGSDTGTLERHCWNRDYLFDILRTLGIRYMFGVPGTSEIGLYPLHPSDAHRHPMT
jgi:hypothetical protein